MNRRSSGARPLTVQSAAYSPARAVICVVRRTFRAQKAQDGEQRRESNRALAQARHAQPVLVELEPRRQHIGNRLVKARNKHSSDPWLTHRRNARRHYRRLTAHGRGRRGLILLSIWTWTERTPARGRNPRRWTRLAPRRRQQGHARGWRDGHHRSSASNAARHLATRYSWSDETTTRGRREACGSCRTTGSGRGCARRHLHGHRAIAGRADARRRLRSAVPVGRRSASLVAMEDADLVIPRHARGYEPLCAIYSRACADDIRSRIDRGLFEASRLPAGLRVTEFDVDNDVMFVNVNTPHDYERAKELVSRCRNRRKIVSRLDEPAAGRTLIHDSANSRTGPRPNGRGSQPPLQFACRRSCSDRHPGRTCAAPGARRSRCARWLSSWRDGCARRPGSSRRKSSARWARSTAFRVSKRPPTATSISSSTGPSGCASG